MIFIDQETTFFEAKNVSHLLVCKTFTSVFNLKRTKTSKIPELFQKSSKLPKYLWNLKTVKNTPKAINMTKIPKETSKMIKILLNFPKWLKYTQNLQISLKPLQARLKACLRGLLVLCLTNISTSNPFPHPLYLPIQKEKNK